MGALQGCMTKNQNLRKDSNGVEIASAQLENHNTVIENRHSEDDRFAQNNHNNGHNPSGSFLGEYNHTRVAPVEIQEPANKQEASESETSDNDEPIVASTDLTEPVVLRNRGMPFE